MSQIKERRLYRVLSVPIGLPHRLERHFPGGRLFRSRPNPRTRRLSAEKQPNGSYCIQPTELFRIFPRADLLASYQIAELQERLALLTAERERERHQLMDQIMDLRRRLDSEAEERRRLSLIVTDQRPRRRWWQFRRNG